MLFEVTLEHYSRKEVQKNQESTYEIRTKKLVHW